MDIAEFEDLIDRLGEDLSRWPAGQRQAAEELVASSTAARGLYEEAQALRRALAGPPVRAPAGLADRIVAAAGELKKEAASRGEGEGETADEPAALAHPGNVLPALLLVLCLLPALAAPEPQRAQPHGASPIGVML
jgi:hypothetical protein